jgi:CDGSH-type Zn-finger protein
MNPSSEFQIRITLDGPYLVSGGVPLAKQHIGTNADGESTEWREGESYPAPPKYALCRCGQSKKKPFCDGTHAAVDFDGTETARRDAFVDQAEVIDGPTMQLLDAPSLCASARFCDVKGKIWNLIKQTDDEAAQALVVEQAAHCPSGRLVVLDKSRNTLEPELAPSIGVTEDTAMNVAGPLWVRGGIPITSSDGKRLEVRNRVALCRCGASKNKPYCDGTHVSIHFRDE